MKILLINPGNPPKSGKDLYSFDIMAALSLAKIDKPKAFGIPLSLPTLAAVTPKKHTVKIIDETITPIDFDQECDLIGITAMTFKANRAYQISEHFRARGKPVILGGIHASMCPDEAQEHVDSVVIGEAEEIWPSILDDFERNSLKPRYQADQKPDITKISPPRHDLTDHSQYFSFFLQTSRGCPYSCKFCTVTSFNGKAIRRKTPQQVIKEIESLFAIRKPPLSVLDRDDHNKRKKLAVHNIFFSDDNFAIDRNHALKMCKALGEFQKENNIALNWFTQVNYRVGLDEELLQELRSAGCGHLFMGFESLSPDALKSMNKNMNSPELYAKAIANVRKYGMDVVFSTIVGSDFDRTNVDQIISDFIDDQKVLYILPNILTPYPGTVLRQEMEEENRIISYDNDLYNIRNVVFKPALMNDTELKKVYLRLCKKTLNFDRLIRIAKENFDNKRYYLGFPTRVGISLIYTFLITKLAIMKKIPPSIMLKAISNIPAFIIFAGGLSPMGYLITSIDFDDFARSEERRLS